MNLEEQVNLKCVSVLKLIDEYMPECRQAVPRHHRGGYRKRDQLRGRDHLLVAAKFTEGVSNILERASGHFEHLGAELASIWGPPSQRTLGPPSSRMSGRPLFSSPDQTDSRWSSQA